MARTIGQAPPHSKENNEILRKIYAEKCNKANKATIPIKTIRDQMGYTFDEDNRPIYQMPCDYICIECKKDYIPIVCDKKDWRRFERNDKSQYLLCVECYNILLVQERADKK